MRIFLIVLLCLCTLPFSLIVILFYLLFKEKKTVIVTNTTNAEGETVSTVVTNAEETEKQANKINIGDRDYWSFAVSGHHGDD